MYLHLNRAPSLDTIYRTYNNIDVAISHQSDDVARLSSRVHKLRLKDKDHKSPASSISSRDRRLPDDHRFSASASGSSSGLRGPINVTPNVAASTAAALNAERGAARLKKSLLKARKEPLLNTQAVDAPIAFSDFKTPQKAGGSGTSTMSFNMSGWKGTFTAGTPTPAGGSRQAIADSEESEEWENSGSFEPIDSFGSPHPPAARHRAGSKHHTKAVQLKKPLPGPGVPSPAPAPAPAPTPAGFSWGPLPGVAPKATLSSDVRQSASGGAGGLPFPLTGLSAPRTTPTPPSLSGSWVTEGFGVRK